MSMKEQDSAGKSTRRPAARPRPARLSPSRAPTMGDVAKAAGVSMTTVSFVLNDRRNTGLRPETVEHVRKTIRDLGYVPNHQARSLALQKTQTIGFIGEDLAAPANGRAVSGAHDVARSHGSALLIVDAEAIDELADAVAELVARQVDAIILNCYGTKEVVLPPDCRIPIVLVNCVTKNRRYPSLMPDDEAGGRQAGQLLVDNGHRRIAYLAGPLAALATRQRVKGFQQAISASGIEKASTPILYGNFRPDSGYDLVREVMKRRNRPTALFLGNDRMALGAYFALADLGLRIPEDVSIVGYDDQEQLADSLHPGLTTMKLPLYELGRLATDHIFARSVGQLPRRTTIGCVLVARGSVSVPAASSVAVSASGAGTVLSVVSA